MQPLKKPTHIVIHHTERDLDFPEFIKLRHKHIRGWEDIGYHYLIGDNKNPHVTNGALYPGRSEKLQGSHVKDHNHYSIGICLIGNLDKKPPTKEQIQTLIQFLKSKMKEHNIPSENIKGHNEFPGVTKTCPGKFVDMDKIRDMLNKE